MKILAIRTDQPESQLFLLNDSGVIDQEIWLADRTLAVSLNNKIKELLDRNNLKLKDLNGLIFYKGPGSFTGLRIGVSVINTLAYALDIPIVGKMGQDWLNDGIKSLLDKINEQTISPFYGSEVYITKAKK